ncbi:2110_t:CDS:1, partial [Cetraspora pellucida]
DGLRPEFAAGTPDCYIQLANQCMDKDPLKRPTAKEVYKKFQEWKIILNKSIEELDQNQTKIQNKFLNADEIIPTIRPTQKQHQD